MHSLGRIPEVNDVVHVGTARFTVLSMEGKRVGTLLLSQLGSRPENQES